jgi:hypothetical protein
MNGERAITPLDNYYFRGPLSGPEAGIRALRGLKITAGEFQTRLCNRKLRIGNRMLALPIFTVDY